MVSDGVELSEVSYCQEHPVFPVADFAHQSVWIIPVESRHRIVLPTYFPSEAGIRTQITSSCTHVNIEGSHTFKPSY